MRNYIQAIEVSILFEGGIRETEHSVGEGGLLCVWIFTAKVENVLVKLVFAHNPDNITERCRISLTLD
jgi:hypothetical protein